jgi:pyruvate/2-oxoglutarate dehydrogenase complex dihydrolipoamide acyltransferase (E2) component
MYVKAGDTVTEGEVLIVLEVDWYLALDQVE